MKFVIAGTYQEAQSWIKKDIERRAITREVVTMNDYFYVSKADDLKGMRDPHGVFVGNWLGRPDILEIVESLLLASVCVNPALGKIYKDLQPKVRPTPKLTGSLIAQAYIDEAANLMAQAIDAEVLRNLTTQINSGI